jgi:hypothetical protein
VGLEDVAIQQGSLDYEMIGICQTGSAEASPQRPQITSHGDHKLTITGLSCPDPPVFELFDGIGRSVPFSVTRANNGAELDLASPTTGLLLGRVTCGGSSFRFKWMP